MSDVFPDNLPVAEQVDALAKIILNEFPEWVKSGGAIETAIQIMREQSKTNERLRVALDDMVEMDPYGVDERDYWCVYCGEHGETTEAIKHDPLCVWVRAEAALTGRADGGA